jgi:glutamate-1-semialdehyde 2,1-aminomutase
MRAGIATLEQLARPEIYERINEQSGRLVVGLRRALAETGIAGQVNAAGSLATLFFTADPVRNYSDAKRSDTKKYGRFFREMLDRGVFLAPSQFEAAFVSAAHTSEDVSRTVAAARDSLRALAEESNV